MVKKFGCFRFNEILAGNSISGPKGIVAKAISKGLKSEGSPKDIEDKTSKFFNHPV